MKAYKVYFKVAGETRNVLLPRHFGIADVKEGFWIDTEGYFTQGNDARAWIPPSQVILVEKVEHTW